MWVVDWLRSHTVDVTPPQAATKIMPGMAEQQTEWRNWMADGMVEWREWREWRNSRKNGMAKWRNGGNGGTVERMAEKNDRNGRLNGFHVCALVCSLSENKSFAFLTWATRRTKKTRRRILLCSSSVLDLSLSCVKLLVENKFFDGKVECQTEMATYVLFRVHTHRQRHWRRRRRRHFNLL